MKNPTLLALAVAMALPGTLAAQNLPDGGPGRETVIPERKTMEQAIIPSFTAEVQSSVSSALEADFTPTPLTGCYPMTVTFVDKSTGNPTAWEWDIDNDGIIDGTTPQFTYTYMVPGNYVVTLTVKDGIGGTASATKEPYVVQPAIPPQAGPDTTVCSGAAVQLGFEPETGGGTPLYEWEPDLYLSDPSIPNPVATPEETTTYIFTINNVGGCVTRDTVTITVNPLPAFPEITRSGNTLTATVDGASYKWYRDGELIGDATEKSYTPTANGSYSVMVLNSSGCSNTSQTFNFILDSGSGVEYGSAIATINLSPNPFRENTVLTLDLMKPSHVMVKLYDPAGREISTLMDGERTSGSLSITIDGTDLAAGVYACRITIGDQVETRTIVHVK